MLFTCRSLSSCSTVLPSSGGRAKRCPVHVSKRGSPLKAERSAPAPCRAGLGHSGPRGDSRWLCGGGKKLINGHLARNGIACGRPRDRGCLDLAEDGDDTLMQIRKTTWKVRYKVPRKPVLWQCSSGGAGIHPWTYPICVTLDVCLGESWTPNFSRRDRVATDG